MSEKPRGLALDIETVVAQRYSGAAAAPEPGLCCPVPLDPALLALVPEEVKARDYGCGDPTRQVRAGEVVLDLGSGAGKACYLLSQVVGPSGRVIGVDLNDDMLALARRHQAAFAAASGLDNLSFRKGRIQDLALDLEAVDALLRARPVASAEALARLEPELARLRREAPLVADASVDVVVSDCVLNLVRPGDRRQLFREVYRVLRRGGRAVISDIVSDEPVPARLQEDPALWSGCVSGAMQETELLRAFEEAGFHGMTVLERPARPWRTVEGIEFRSVTVAAYKGKEGPCWERKQAVIYLGPFKEVTDDDGHVLPRGVPVAVCEKTFGLYARAPYAGLVAPVEPLVPVPPGEVRPFPCGAGTLVRDPRETKGQGFALTTEAEACCAGGSCTP